MRGERLKPLRNKSIQRPRETFDVDAGDFDGLIKDKIFSFASDLDYELYEVGSYGQIEYGPGRKDLMANSDDILQLAITDFFKLAMFRKVAYFDFNDYLPSSEWGVSVRGVGAPRFDRKFSPVGYKNYRLISIEISAQWVPEIRDELNPAYDFFRFVYPSNFYTNPSNETSLLTTDLQSVKDAIFRVANDEFGRSLARVRNDGIREGNNAEGYIEFTFFLRFKVAKKLSLSTQFRQRRSSKRRKRKSTKRRIKKGSRKRKKPRSVR